MVLEGLVTNILNRVLGMYVQNFDPKQLNIGILGGDVQLRNLELRKEALDQLHLPLNVVEGHLGELTLKIPLTNLRGAPVRVNIKDVFVLAAPREDADFDPKEEEDRQQRVKMEKLESAELLKERNSEGMSQEEQKKQQSFVSSLTTAIIDNLQVNVENIHIRYEDSISDPGHPFAAGITLRGFSAQSTDENWIPKFISGASSSTHKLAKLEALAIYWDTDAKLLGQGIGSDNLVGEEGQGLSHDELLDAFRSMITTGNDETVANHQFILKPVTGRAGIELDKTGKTDRPKMKANFMFDELGFVLDEDQYRDALMLVDLFHYFIRHQEYKKLQPKSSPKDDPRAWLAFAGHAVLDRIRDRRYKSSMDYIMDRRHDRIKYIDLFKRKKKEERLTAEEVAEMDKLERKLTYEDLRFWRSLARNQLRKENVGVKPQQKQSWGQWMFGYGKKQEDTTITEEEKEKLYEAIDFDEKKAIAEAVDQPKDMVKMQAYLSLRTGSLTLKRDPHNRATEILKLLFENFNTSFTQRPESFLAKLNLQGVRLKDGTTEGSLFPQIITVKQDTEEALQKQIEQDNENEDSSQEVEMTLDDEVLQRRGEDAFFKVAFEKNPLDGSADNAIDLRLKGMEIIYNPTFLVEVVKFFKPPERHMESIGALMETAGQTVEGIRKQTRAGLEFALQEHKTINANFDLQAPLIIIPDSITKQSSLCMILDAGHASVTSDLVDKTTLNEIQAKQKQVYSDEDYSKLEKLMYDKFKLKLESTQVLIGPSIEATRAQLTQKDESKHMHLVDRINMEFLIEICIVPKGSDLTKFRITGKLPVLQASISDAKYKNLMRLIDVAIPHFEESSSTSTPASKAVNRSNPTQNKIEAAATGRPRSRSFQFSSQEHELLVEEDEELRKPDTFKDAPRGEQAPGVSIRQRNFEFVFIVEKLQGSLYRSDPDGQNPDQLLAELIAQDFKLDFYQRRFDMTAEVSLRSLVLEDHIEQDPRPEFKKIISSDDSNDSEQGLFQLKFVKVNPESPEFQPKFDGIAMNLDVSVSTINVVVTRKTILTLLDFVLVTFTSPSKAPESETEQQAIQDSNSDGADASVEQQSSSDKIRIKAELKTIAMILNNDGIRLATLSLNTATVALTIMGKTMRLSAKLGNMSLIDDINQGASETSSLRQLLTIQGDELADFTYETFDADSDTYPGHDSSIHLQSGSLKINFVTEPYRKIIEFFVKFGKMQAIFNAARQAAAEQASQMQERANRIQFNILVRTPIVVFPRIASTDRPERDLLTAYLGEIYANNKFRPVDDSENADIANQLSVGIQNVRLTSLLHYDDEESEELQLLQKVDLGFDMTYVEHKPLHKRPQLEARGNLSDLNLRLTSQQLKLAMELSQSISSAFQFDSEEISEQMHEDVDKTTSENAKAIKDAKSQEGVEHPTQNDEKQNLGPELGSDPEKWTNVDLIFTAGAVGLELISASEDARVGDLEKASLSKFSLNDTNVKLRMMSDGALESELLIKSFTITDTRKHGTNKFRKIMSLINNEITQQFMANVTISGGKDRNLMAILTIDSPQVILSLDYLFALSDFVSHGMPTPKEIDIDEELDDEDEDDNLSTDSTAVAKSEKGSEGGMTMAFRANLVDAQVILLANAAISSSEAIVLGMKQAILAKQHATTLQVEKVGMFLCRMDRFDTSRLRILDDFSIATSLDIRSTDPDSTLTNIQVDVEPLVLRLSLRDILLVMQIVSKASELSGKDTETTKEDVDEEPQKVKEIKKSAKSHRGHRASTTAGKHTHSIQSQPNQKTIRGKEEMGSAILKHEEMNLHVGGIRIVLIGDLHELPMLDWSVKEFAIDVRDWTGALTADLTLDTFLNVYNFSKSAWEPMIEPWSVGFHASRDQNTSKLSADIFSRKPMEITVTSATIAVASKSFQFLSADQDVLAKPRGTDSPYRIRNYTGFDLDVWAISDGEKEGNAAKIPEGQEIPWRFEDPTTTRETLAPEGASGIVGIRLQDSGFDSIEKIPVNREGEKLYSLSPRKDKILHRLLVEIKLGSDNVKYITFRSPLLVENNTYFPIELGIFNTEQGTLEKIDKIAPEQARPSPVGAAFSHSVIIRPNEGLGYTWSDERLFWKDIVKRPSRTIMCRGDSKDSHPFYFQLNAIYNKSDPVPSIYPYMRLRLSAPVELENLLPYDFKYRIYDRKTKGDYANFLRKGGVSPIHVVNLSHLLLLSVDLQDTPFKQSEFAIINSPDREFSREKSIQIKDTHGLNLRLKLHYYNIPDSGGAFKVSVYSPYVVLNRTGMELDIRSKAFLGAARAAAGQGIWEENHTEDAQRAVPFMFSFQTDDPKNRALIKVGDSDWSKPQSFDAIGSVTEVKVAQQNGRTEMQLGVSVKQGEGKYQLTKVVTIAPRFVLRNNLGEDLNVREPGSSDIISLQSGALLPLRFIRQRANQQLSVCYPGLNDQWSSSFYIGNVGRVHVKLAKDGRRQQLIKVETILEEATLFIHFTYSNHWPFSIRNESTSELYFFQENPNLDEDDENRYAGGWRPIRYRLPSRSIMPYAWDYPASKNKYIILQVAKKERSVKFAEIGEQRPLEFVSQDGDRAFIGIDVVADGPKQELVLSDRNPSLSLYRQKTNRSTTSTAAFEVKEQDTKVTISASMRFAGIGVSLINSNLRELMYINLRDIEFKYNESTLFQTVKLTTKWIQIDNQLYGSNFPIILYPSVVPKTGKELETHPIFHAALTRVKDDSYGVLYIKYFTILLQQITVEVDEDFVFMLLDFTKVPGASWSEVKEGKLCDEALDIPEPQQEEQGQDIYFELLHLQPMQIDFSFVRMEHVNAEETMATNSPFMFAFNVLTMSLGNVNDAPLRYNALMVENARIDPGAMLSRIQAHYTQETLQQIHIVLGSADFLGNPVGLFNNISSGVADIFYEPYQGLVMTDRPQDLGLGIAKGASSFVKKSVFGFSDSFAKFTGSMAKGLAAASLDKEFQDQRRMSKSRNRPKHALYGITAGGNAFATSLASGIGGLARHPMEGAEKEGVGGFVKGVGKGFLGFATKTPLAAIDLASSVAEGIRNTTTVFDADQLDRVRLPRFVGQDGIVRPYSQREALGQFWLKTLDNGKYFNEQYIAHLDLPGKDMMAMLTYNDILLVRTKKLQTEWDVPLKDIAKIAKERTGMNITLKEGRSGPFIPIEDESGRNFLYKQLAIAVNAYNEKHSLKA